MEYTKIALRGETKRTALAPVGTLDTKKAEIERLLEIATAQYFKHANSYQTSKNAYVTRLCRITMEKFEAQLELLNEIEDSVEDDYRWTRTR